VRVEGPFNDLAERELRGREKETDVMPVVKPIESKEEGSQRGEANQR
jgi:hypothetical protein